MSETPEEKELCLKNARKKVKAKRMQETPEEKKLQLKNARERSKAKRMEETPEEKEACLNKAKVKRMEETPEEKEACLEKAKTKRMEETPEEKEVHLKKLRRNGKLRLEKNPVNQKDSLKINNNGLLLALCINQLSSQVRKIGRNLNHR